MYFITTNVKPLDEVQITLYPNPTSTAFTVSSTNKTETIKVFDLLGEEIITTKPNNYQSTININQLQKGIYFVEIKTERGAVRKKIIKQ